MPVGFRMRLRVALAMRMGVGLLMVFLRRNFTHRSNLGGSPGGGKVKTCHSLLFFSKQGGYYRHWRRKRYFEDKMIQFQNLIAGLFTPAQNSQHIPFLSPLTGMQVGEIADSDFMDGVRALQAANHANQSLRKLTRAQQLPHVPHFWLTASLSCQWNCSSAYSNASSPEVAAQPVIAKLIRLQG